MSEPTITVRGAAYTRKADGFWYRGPARDDDIVPPPWGDVLDALHEAREALNPPTPERPAWRYPVLSAEDAAKQTLRRNG